MYVCDNIYVRAIVNHKLYSCVIYVQTLHVVVNFLVFVFYICCFVIVNVPVIYVCRFANVVRNSFKSYKGSRNFEIRSRDHKPRLF